MEKKNISTLQTFILLCVIVVPFQSLFSSQRNPNKPATITIDTKEDFEAEINKELDDAEIAEQLESDITTASSTKEVQVATPAPGLLVTMYATVAPIILVTLNKALGTGIAASTKSMIKGFMQRSTLLATKTKLEEELQQNIAMYAQQGIDLREGMGALPEKNQKALLKNISLIQNIEDNISFSSILGQAIYIGMLNTVIPMVGSFVGLGTTMLLQNFMPADNS